MGEKPDFRLRHAREDADEWGWLIAVCPKKEVEWWCDKCLTHNGGHHDPCCYCGIPKRDSET